MSMKNTIFFINLKPIKIKKQLLTLRTNTKKKKIICNLLYSESFIIF